MCGASPTLTLACAFSLCLLCAFSLRHHTLSFHPLAHQLSCHACLSLEIASKLLKVIWFFSSIKKPLYISYIFPLYAPARATFLTRTRLESSGATTNIQVSYLTERQESQTQTGSQKCKKFYCSFCR
ncbi:hypothetical protein J3R30DRAFT_3474623 [Lentinula aciculospora]|uniref:Secreted protein n=1 Tax=Lentinula aciculospora TaxID=153920 RepID=A0A9W9DNJ1_9AGAR|nr:hypothetical protein J3R30DRAFT_3474623 [Lentinula aciculospora]